MRKITSSGLSFRELQYLSTNFDVMKFVLQLLSFSTFSLCLISTQSIIIKWRGGVMQRQSVGKVITWCNVVLSKHC